MGVVISDDGRYRYWLDRDLPWRLDAGQSGHLDVTCAFIMLNPSTADTVRDDPTIRRCMHFATVLGATRLVVANLYAYRATKPSQLRYITDPEGSENRTYLERALRAHYVIAAFGNHAPEHRVARFRSQAAGTHLWCLGTTSTGAPRHPLYVPNMTELQPWDPEAPPKRREVCPHNTTGR